MDRRLQEALIGMPPLDGRTGKFDHASALQQVIDCYGISNIRGAFQMDQSNNTDTCIEALAELYPIIDVGEQRLRCPGHVINLVVKALFCSDGLASFQKEPAETNEAAQYTLWHKQGAIGTLRKIVRCITRSGKRRAASNSEQREVANKLEIFCLKLKRDTGSRSNSVYTILQRALQLEAAITLYCHRWKQTTDETHLSADEQDVKDWEELRHCIELPKPFDSITKRVEGYTDDGAYGAE